MLAKMRYRSRFWRHYNHAEYHRRHVRGTACMALKFKAIGHLIG